MINRQIKYFVSLILIFFALNRVASFAGDTKKETEAEKYYEQALIYCDKGQNELAIQNLKTALKLNTKLARAYNKLALIYMGEGTLYGRSRATIELEKALKLEPKNVEFLFNDAILNLRKGFTSTAAKLFKKIVKLDPQHYWAFYHLAVLKEEEMLHYQNMISIEPASDGIIFMNSFAQKLQQEAADYYQKALAVNPKFTDAYYRLAFIYYEFDNYDEMIQLLESAVKIIPDDKNCHLFLGFAYQNVGKFHFAADEYQLAKQLMTATEREALESIDKLLTPEQMKRYQLISPSEQQLFQQAFWASKDPFYLTEVNERELEHFSRVAYANLRFSKPEKHIEGWQTDQGKTLIRFGKPIYKFRTRPYLGTFVGNGRNPLHYSKEIWIYPDFHFVFADEFLSRNYTFARADLPEFDYKLIFDRMIKNVPDYYKFIPDSQSFQVPFDIVAFQGQNGKTELEFCYSIPTPNTNVTSSADKEVKLLQGIFFFDQFWHQVAKKVKEISFAATDVSMVNFQSYYNNHESVELMPGNYYFSLEFQDENSNHKSRILQAAKVDTFFYDQLQLSDILFASDLQPPNLNVPPSRADFNFNPNPLKIFRRGDPVVIYYEIYNLILDVAGETHFNVEYRIGKDFQSIPAWKKLLTNAGLRKKTGEVTSSYDYIGKTSTELQYQKIMLDPQMKGKINLTLKVTDLFTGEVRTKQKLFTVTE